MAVKKTDIYRGFFPFQMLAGGGKSNRKLSETTKKGTKEGQNNF